jgi:hypothetical protein
VYDTLKGALCRAEERTRLMLPLLMVEYSESEEGRNVIPAVAADVVTDFHFTLQTYLDRPRRVERDFGICCEAYLLQPESVLNKFNWARLEGRLDEEAMGAPLYLDEEYIKALADVVRPYILGALLASDACQGQLTCCDLET